MPEEQTTCVWVVRLTVNLRYYCPVHVCALKSIMSYKCEYTLNGGDVPHVLSESTTRHNTLTQNGIARLTIIVEQLWCVPTLIGVALHLPSIHSLLQSPPASSPA